MTNLDMHRVWLEELSLAEVWQGILLRGWWAGSFRGARCCVLDIQCLGKSWSLGRCMIPRELAWDLQAPNEQSRYFVTVYQDLEQWSS